MLDPWRAPLVIVDGREVTRDQHDRIHAEDIASITVLNGRRALDRFGEQGRDGVLILEMKRGWSGS